MKLVWAIPVICFTIWVTGFGGVQHVQAQSSVDIEYGEYLAGECGACHIDGSHIPQLDGMSAELFLDTMLRLKTDKDANILMRDIALQLNWEELTALAGYFAQSADQLTSKD